MLKKPVIIVDGPSATGKSTLAQRLSSKLGLPVRKYKALGPANIIAKLLIRLRPNLLSTKNYDPLRHDTISVSYTHLTLPTKA